MRNRQSEVFCKTTFDKYLREHFPQHRYSWRKLAQEEEPPDYELTINDKHTWGVEVTQTKLSEKTILDAEIINLLTFRNSTRRLVEELEQECISTNVLHGKYIIYFNKPIIKKGYKRIREFLRPEIISYLKNTQEVGRSTEIHKILKEGITVCKIRKWHNKTSGLIPQFSARAAFIHSRKNIILFKNMLQTAIDEKMHTLSRVNYINPCILLFLDNYQLTDKELFSTVADEITNADFFHGVYIISFGSDIYPVKEIRQFIENQKSKHKQI